MKKLFIILYCLALSFCAKSQILYTDLVPNELLTTPSNSTGDSIVYKNFDINQDGINDLQLRAFHYFTPVNSYCCWSTFNEVRGLNGGEMLKIPVGGPTYSDCTVPTEPDDTIYVDGSWTLNAALNAEVWVAGYIVCYQSPEIHFYGIRVKIENDYYYGWLRIYSNLQYIMLYDMAINLTPNEPIIPNQTITGTNLASIEEPKLTVYPNPSSSQITIHANGQSAQEAIIYNHLGQKVLEAVPVNNTVDVSGLNAGIYFMEVATKEWKGRTKLIIE
jgi:hypothetical protein